MIHPRFYSCYSSEDCLVVNLFNSSWLSGVAWLMTSTSRMVWTPHRVYLSQTESSNTLFMTCCWTLSSCMWFLTVTYFSYLSFILYFILSRRFNASLPQKSCIFLINIRSLIFDVIGSWSREMLWNLLLDFIVSINKGSIYKNITSSTNLIYSSVWRNTAGGEIYNSGENNI